MRLYLLLLIFFSILGFGSFAQSDVLLSHQQTIYLGSGRFFDSGGENGEMPNEFLLATIKAPGGYIHAFFTMFDLPIGSELRLYKDADTTQLIGIYNGEIKPVDIYAKEFTVVYDPKQSSGTRPGFAGVVEPFVPSSLEIEKATLPESDCIGAIPLCSNNTVNTSANQYDNTGNVNDDNGSCYSGTGNGGSVWYSFSPMSNGNLDFMITPTGSTDYDFVLWDITNGCANKTQISCNYSGTTGATGLNSSGNTNSQDASGTTNNQLENVQTTHTYALCINYYSGNNAGFTLNFHNIPSTVNIVDNIPPTITNAYTSNCTTATQFTINFSEYIDCNTLQASDFVIPGYTVSLITTNCNNGKTNNIVIGVSPAMPPGNYNMTVSGINDLCGNPLNQVYPINTLVVPVANAGPDQVACSSPGLFGSTNYGSVTLTGSGGSNYVWSTGQAGSSISVSPHSTTTYTLTAISGGCSSTDQVVVTVSPSPTPNLGPDQTVCAGFPITLNASGGGTYQWQSTTNTNFFGQPTGWTNIPGATNPIYTGSPGGTIYYRVIVTNAAGCQGTDWIKVTIGSGAFGITAPPFICQGNSATLTLPGSMTQYTWNQAGTPIGSPNLPLNVSPSNTTVYTAVSTTPGCTGSADVTVFVHQLGTITANANPTNPCPGDQVNLTSNAPANSNNSSTENFESSNSFTLINGANNKWYYGTATSASATHAIYIGTAVGDNNYIIGSAFSPKAATNFAYKNYTVTSYCSPTVSFNWKCNGQSGKAELTVWAVPTSFTPSAGTQITAGSGNVLLGGPYFGSTTYTNVSIDLSAFSGTTFRLVFQWRNDGAALFGGPTVANPAASVDDIVFTDNTTYNNAWTSSNTGFTAGTANATDNASVATTYTLTTTRCDGCPMTSAVSITVCNPLPVDLVAFTGEKQAQANQLNWTSENENRLAEYILERSIDMKHWEKIASTTPKNNAGNGKQFYQYDDYSFVNNAINYYRLTSKDLDNTYTELDQLVSINNRERSKQVLYRTNMLGQLVSDQQKGFIIMVYEDGTTEKTFVSE